MTMKRLLIILPAVILAACSSDETVIPQDTDAVRLTTSIAPFSGDALTRTTLDGTSFESGDMVRMKIICPHTDAHQAGEIWSSGYYTFTITGVGDTWVSGNQSMETQATTYIYTAQNTIDYRIYVVGNYRYSRPSNFFYADQSTLDNYKKSDVVWAQAIRQTGAREVHLRFEHKVAKLDITIDDLLDTPLADDAHLTLEGMPDIDGAEIVVGDYYADECYEGEAYTYRDKASCSYANNGRVLGIEVIKESPSRSSIAQMTGNPLPGGAKSDVVGTVPNTGIYTCYRVAPRHYYLHVPPCTLTSRATFWIRDGERRYSAQLEPTTFEEGKCYPVRLTLN